MPAHRDEARDEPVFLAPLDYETALRALLAVDPESEPANDSGIDPKGDHYGGEPQPPCEA